MTDGTPHYTRPDVAAFLAFLNMQEGPKMEEMPPEGAREMFRAMGQIADVPRGEIAHVEDRTIPGPAGALPIRIYDNRPDREPGPVMVFYHGGGWVIGDLDTHDPYCAEAARQLDMPVIAVDYRLAPEHPFPAAPEDCEAATRWVADNVPCTGLVLSGESAGGNLTIATALTLRDKPASKPVIAIHPIYPAVTTRDDWQSYRDFGEGHLLTKGGMAWFGNHYAADPGDYRASPLDFPAEGLPPTLLVTAGLDPLRDQGRAYAAKLIEAGVPTSFREAKGNIHGYINLAQGIPSAKDDIRGALTILKAIVADANAAA
ncbi:alpha/beta hydrolase [Sphingopyxis alaskensis]|jgi:acetyl esterase|uniref:Alpha/beta hydrolase fold-3 n=1 Tax=Sphingopyxis alaskensis (strain DSM 13593 / LMG 18877 / RB2256) TaxID=317655 RepID=Q1GSW0_SPHAL|nr:alpha/beta hydrolase [Sphingopyxis alaskensis]ABF53262.1 Alpha/beta hydrolase fold-3 [Sphingopyxis alaskensis RB2256]MCM3418681.1 alpha/beta hydrolase [Sphingopyxis alaskensis]